MLLASNDLNLIYVTVIGLPFLPDFLHNSTVSILFQAISDFKMNNPGSEANKKLLIGLAAGAAALYGAYLYGQKNPKKNALDVPP